MIVLFEPLCKDISHERVNAGILLGVRSAFPHEQLCFFADASHISSLKELLALEHIDTNGFLFKPVEIEDRDGLVPILRNIRILRRIFDSAVAFGSTRVLFTAVSPTVMFSVRILKRKSSYKALKCFYVMHGILETVGARKDALSAGPGIESPPALTQNKEAIDPAFDRLLTRLRRVGLARMTADILCLVIRRARTLLTSATARMTKEIYEKTVAKWLSTGILNFKNILEELDPDWGGVILLAPHILTNLRKHIQTSKLKVSVVTMPYLFSREEKRHDFFLGREAKGEFARFGVVGKGHPGRLRELASLILRDQPRGNFEIVAYTMNNQGFDRYPIIRTFGQGKRVPRETIRLEAPSIDYFLYLYDETEYYLSCSASFFEVFSNVVPFLSLPCESIGYFNTEARPIGYRCAGIAQMASLMKEIVDEPKKFRNEREEFCANILRIRANLDVQRNPALFQAALE